MAKRGSGGGGLFAPGEVSQSSLTSRSGNRPGNRSRTSRAADVSGKRLTVTHVPTGLSVHGSVPDDHYSKAELRVATDELRARLLSELAIKVRQARSR